MKEVTESFKETTVEIVEERQQEKQIKLIGKQRKIPGLTLWEFNHSTKQLSKAKYKPVSVMISASLNDSETTRVFKCVVNENCLYFQALNEPNARKKLIKAKLL